MYRKILIIRFSSIGDIVLTTPVIRALKDYYPLSVIHFITRKEYISLLENNPYLDKCIAYNESLFHTAATLKSENYDLVIDLHSNLKSLALFCLLSPTIHWIRYRKLTFRKWATVLWKFKYPNVHVTQQYLNSLKALGIDVNNAVLQLFLNAEERNYPLKLPFTHSAGYAVLAIGATHFTKKMPLEKWIELCRNLNLPLVIIGGKTEKDWGQQLAKIDEFKIIDRCGDISLRQSMALIQKAKFVVTHDTGMMHIAAAFDKKIYSIWGGTVPEMGFSPQLLHPEKSMMIEVKGMNCRPCSKYGRSECPKKHFNCMNNINLSPILQHTLQDI